MKFKNRRFFRRQEFNILHSSLKIENRTLLDSDEYEVPFEHIHNKKRIQTTTNNNLLFLSFFLLVIGLLFQLASNPELSFTLIILAVILLIVALVARQKTVTIPIYDGGKIKIFYNKRNKNEVLDFSDKIIEASNSFLLNKYSKIDRALPLEGQINNLNFLLDRNIITNEEYENLKDQLLGRGSKGSMGFNR